MNVPADCLATTFHRARSQSVAAAVSMHAGGFYVLLMKKPFEIAIVVEMANIFAADP